MDSFYAQTSHTCNFCHKLFSTYGDLVEHKKSHVGDRPFSCHICHKRFTQKAHLNIHKRTHTGEKPYACHVCHKRFAQSSHLNSHKRVHAGDRPYFCVMCNTGFSQKHRFDAHLPCMEQAQNRQSTGLTSGGVTSGGILPNSRHFDNTARSFANVGRVEDDEGVPEQKPDIKYLQSLNQEAYLQLPAISNVVESVAGEALSNIDANLEEGEISRNESLSGSEMTNHSSSEETAGTGNMSSYFPATSAHRRKPAFIRRVDNDSTSPLPAAEMDNDCNVNVNCTSIASDADHYANEKHDENTLDYLAEQPELPIHNGDKNGIVNGSIPVNQSLLPTRITPAIKYNTRSCSSNDRPPSQPSPSSTQGRANHRISLVNFTAEELLNHIMTRADVHRCDFCRLIFQDAAMYHIHRNMHDKNDLRCCNFCGKMLQDRYDFTAHFLNEHR